MTDLEFRIRISKGNRKLGFIPSVSLPPIETCPAGIPCGDDCYVVRNMLGGPWGKQIKKSYDANLEFFRADRDGFFAQLWRYLARKKPDLFRFHVSGDFVDAAHLDAVIATANIFPAIGFLVFTKNHAILPPHRMIPKNLALIASMWPGWNSKPPRGYRRAWMDDGTDTRIPRSALRCPGNCETCGMCWQLREIKRDVRFKRH